MHQIVYWVPIEFNEFHFFPGSLRLITPILWWVAGLVEEIQYVIVALKKIRLNFELPFFLSKIATNFFIQSLTKITTINGKHLSFMLVSGLGNGLVVFAYC